MKCIVCIACRIVLPTDCVGGHLKNAAHKSGKRIVPKLSANLANYIATLDLDDTQVLRPTRGSITPAYTWLEKPKEGWICQICGVYAAAVTDTLRHHVYGKIARGHKIEACKDSDPSLQKVRYQDVIEKCVIQRFSTLNPLATYFRVYPNVSVETGPRFTGFLSSLPDPLKKGVPLYSADARSIQTKEFDLPPFLAKTKWTEAVKGYSWNKMIKSVSIPAKDDKLLSRLLPLGIKLLTSIPSTTDLPHQILNRLTAYKTKQYV